MKKIGRLIRRGTALIPVEFKTLKQHSTYLILRSHPIARYLFVFFREKKAFSLIVLLPWMVFALYILAFKSPTYESVAKILVEKDNNNESMSASMSIWNNNNALTSEIYLTREHILSREILNQVEKKQALKQHFQNKKVDFLSRLSKSATSSAFLDYYQHKINAVVDPETNQIIITATAFSPDTAKKLLHEIILQTKEFVNRVSNTVAKKQYTFTKLKLHLAKEKLFNAGKSVIAWQNKNGVFDPKETAQVVASVMAKLKGTLVEKQTELITYSSFMQPNSNKVITLQEEIKAIKQQIERQTHVLLGEKKTNGKLNKIMSDFEWIQLQLKFAQAEYQAAQQAFDEAAISLIKNQNMVIVIEPPNLPDEIASPLPFFDLTNAFFFLLILFVLIKMTLIIIREHID